MKLLEEGLELLYPSRCCFCHRLRGKGVVFCSDCERDLPWTRSGAFQQLEKLEGCWSPLYYEKDVRSSLLRYKFSGRRGYADVYGKILAKCLDENAISCDIITWVPLSARRKRRRGYDQAFLLASALGERLGMSPQGLLRKRRHNPPQSGAGGLAQRRRNVKGAYEIQAGVALKGKTILLVDDIVTTGSTLSECAGVLKAAGAKSVLGLSLARKRE